MLISRVKCRYPASTADLITCYLLLLY